MLKDILAIAGYSGLFKYLKKGRNGIIVENLESGKRMNADASARINALEDISIYTLEGEKPLEEVFKAIYEYEERGRAINPKKASGEELKDYFGRIVPDYDEDRVYTSDIKKILTWYNKLHHLDLLHVEDSNNEEEAGGEQNNGSNESSGSGKENKD